MRDKNIKLFPVLLAGGSGTRLWPVSREFFPKQLVRFFGNESLIQHTVKRLFPVFEPENIRIVCGKKHSGDICRDMEAAGISTQGKIIDEPCGRNTAPAILLAVLEILKQETDAIIFIFPADHVIRDVSRFHDKVKSAVSLADQNYIVTFGITPEYPETGYGYIEASEHQIEDAFSIQRFVEKPDLETAETYLKAGNFFWNSGMFAFKASVILKEFETFKPNMVKQFQEIFQNSSLTVENYSQIENISIDYAVMENTAKGVILPSDFGWSDIGSWKSLYDFLPKDKDGNVVTTGDVILQQTRNSFVMGHDRLIAVNHLENLAVVETPDAIFVSDIENSRDVKSIVNVLKEKGRSEHEFHTTVYHPWGYEKILENGHASTVKRIVVYAGADIPEQQQKGNKQWLVVQGTAHLTLSEHGDETSVILEASQSVKIPENTVYKLKNIGESELHIIEVKKEAE